MANLKSATVPAILTRLALVLGTEINDGRLVIPETFGRGYCAGFVFNEYIRLLILNYELYENLLVDNPKPHTDRKTILFKFQNIFSATEMGLVERQARAIPSVLIVTSTVTSDTVVPIHSNTATINIEVDADYLRGLLHIEQPSPVLQSLLQNIQPLLFEQVVYPSLQNTVNEMLTESVGPTFTSFFLRVKAEELVCRLLMELEKRDEKQLYALNGQDIQILYALRTQMLEQLDTPPIIDELAAFANMSPTKLKRLFKQIFGNSIFSYYQTFRMKEAARLLAEEKLSVSEVGYQLGFTNLSHFTRVFEEHIGVKPKKYAMMQIR